VNRRKSLIAPLALVALFFAASLPTAPGAAPAASPGSAPAASGAPSLDEILSRFDRAQTGIRTMTANFTETKDLKLLREPVVSKGKFYYTRPNDILWEYTDPTAKVFLIRKDELLAYYPQQRRAERVDISRFQSRLLKVFGIGQLSEDLNKYYDLALAPKQPAPGLYDLILTPRRRMVKKRIAQVRFWIDAKSFLPVRMEYFEQDGDRTILSFDETHVNAAIDEATYRIELPPGVDIQTTFTGIGSGKGAS